MQQSFDVINIPGYYFDVERNRYFRIGTAAPSTTVINSTIETSVGGTSDIARNVANNTTAHLSYSKDEIKRRELLAKSVDFLEHDFKSQYKAIMSADGEVEFFTNAGIGWASLLSAAECGMSPRLGDGANAMKPFNPSSNDMTLLRLRMAKKLEFKKDVDYTSLGSINSDDISCAFVHRTLPIVIIGSTRKKLSVFYYKVFPRKSGESPSCWSMCLVKEIQLEGSYPPTAIFVSRESSSNGKISMSLGYSTLCGVVTDAIRVYCKLDCFEVLTSRSNARNDLVVSPTNSFIDGIYVEVDDGLTALPLDATRASSTDVYCCSQMTDGRSGVAVGFICGSKNKIDVQTFGDEEMLTIAAAPESSTVLFDATSRNVKTKKWHISKASGDIICISAIKIGRRIVICYVFRCKQVFLHIVSFGTKSNIRHSRLFIGEIPHRIDPLWIGIRATSRAYNVLIYGSNGGLEVMDVAFELFSNKSSRASAKVMAKYCFSGVSNFSYRLVPQSGDWREVKTTPCMVPSDVNAVVALDGFGFLWYRNTHRASKAKGNTHVILDCKKDKTLLEAAKKGFLKNSLSEIIRRPNHGFAFAAFAECPVVEGIGNRASSYTFLFTIRNAELNLWCM